MKYIFFVPPKEIGLGFGRETEDIDGGKVTMMVGFVLQHLMPETTA